MAILDVVMSSAITPAIEFCKAHTTELLIGVGIGGFVGAVINGIKTTKKATIIEQVEENNKKAPLSTKERVKLVGKMYIPTILLVLLSGTCIVLGVTHALKVNAALTVALASSERAIAEYKDATKIITGEDKLSEIEQIASKKNTLTPVNVDETKNQSSVDQNASMINNPNDSAEYLFRDADFERYFISSKSEIKNIITQLNYDIQHEGYKTYNDFYSYIGLSPIPRAYECGWNPGGKLIEPHFSYSGAPDGRPCVVVKLYPSPTG